MIDIEKKACIEEIVYNICSIGKKEMTAIVLLGGINREKIIIDGWSDLDLILIWKNISCKSLKFVSKVINNIEKKYDIRIDINQILEKEIVNDVYKEFLFNGIIINSLKRNDQHIVLFGRIPEISISDEQEKSAALYYINQMLFWQREYFIEFIYKKESIRKYYPQLLRRTFSIVRASLRLFDIFCNPYEESINNLEKIFPKYNVLLLKKLLYIRSNFKIIKENELKRTADNIHKFIESYIPFIIKEYSEYDKG